MADERTHSLVGTGTLETSEPGKGQPGEPDLRRGSVVGRYVIIDPLGSGGMGVVFAAYDPELNRKIAIKLLKPGVGRDLSARRLRLIREAQALAQLSHPNVIAIYDVGTFGDQVFMAMELVEGPTLRAWLRVENRSWRSIVRVFQQAGEALATAHAAGVVHRDFKPENVIVGHEGRLRVVDFGLALTDQVDVEKEDLIALGDGSFPTLMTRTGALVGTPAYMSPEQRTGRGTDARTDQFSFCVSLYEALFGQRPPDDVSAVEKIETRNVPKRLRALLHRGLQPNPDERYAQMTDLLDELGRCVSTTGRKSWLAAAAVMTCAIAISTYFGIQHRRPALCGGAPQKLAGAWDPARANAIHAAFRATGKPYAEQAFTSVQRQLDSYAGRWAQMHTEACEATRVRGEQSEQLLDLRMECLDTRLRELKATTDLFASADAQVVANAIQAAQSLPELEPCADATSLRARVKPPTDPGIRARVDDLHNQFATINALGKAGKYRQAEQLAAQLAKQAEALRYRPVEAEALQVWGSSQADIGDWRHAEEALRRAITTAEACGHIEIELEAWSNLVSVLGQEEDRLAEAHFASQHAFAIIEHLGGHELQSAAVLIDVANVYRRQQRFDEMLRCYSKALAIRERILGADHYGVGMSLHVVGVGYSLTGDYPTALGYYQRALPVLERSLGPDHPVLGRLLVDMGELLKLQGHYAEARPYQERALGIFQTSLGPTHPQVALDLINLGEISEALGEYGRALRDNERALAIERKNGPTPTLLSASLAGIGYAQVQLGHPERAIAPLEEVVAQPLHTGEQVAIRRKALFALARALWETRRDRSRARRLASEALEGMTATDDMSTHLRAEIQAWQKKHR
jgi:tetratricopeptide (TPR) repeat protein